MERIDANFGVISTDELGLLFQDFDIPTPEIQEHKIEIPYRDGSVDLTSAYGKTAYNNRVVTLKLADARDYQTRQTARRSLQTAIHGKERDLVLSIQPEYTIRGRWSIEVDETHARTLYVVTGDCQPFRLLGTFTYRFNAAGGVLVALPGGDKHVRPIIQVNRPAVIQFEGATYQLNPGAYYIEDLYFHEGTNVLYVDTFPDGGSVTWNDLKSQSVTWGEFASKRVSEWRWGDEPPQERATWGCLKSDEITWRDFSAKAVFEWQYPVDPTDESYTVYIQYTREDF